MTLNVCVAGATGWVGKPLCLAVTQAEDMSLVGAVSRTYAGRPMRDVIGETGREVTVRESVDEALATPTDVLVDYTRADVARAHVMSAIRRGVHVVIGSSGLSDEDFVAIDQAAHERGVGVIAAGNFAITAVLLQRFACEAARYVKQWEIIDYATDAKPDAPSGTARELAYRLAQVREPQVTVPIDQTIGLQESRGATVNGTQIHSVRLPGFVFGVEIILGANDERLSIRHQSGSGAEPYIQGTMLAIREAPNYVGLVRGLDKIMK